MEAGTMPQRPPKVKLAVYLLYVSLVIGTIMGCLESAEVPPLDGLLTLGTFPMILIAVLVFGVWPLLYYTIGKGRNWARLTLIILPIALALLVLPTEFIAVIAGFGIWFGIWFGFYYMIGKGRNWARMIFLILQIAVTVFVVPSLFILFFTEMPLPLWDAHEVLILAPFPPTPLSIAHTILQIATAILQIVALVLLFQRDSSDWFKAMKISKIKEEEFEKKGRVDREPGEALMGAARTGNIEQVQELLGKGADVNSRNEWGLTPLMAAAQGDHIEAGKLLLEKGADINSKQKDGWTTLMVASSKGHGDFVNLLLGKGVDVNARTESRMTALTLARTNGRSQVVEVLKAHGAEA